MSNMDEEPTGTESDSDRPMSDAESEGSYNLARLFSTLEIAEPTNELEEIVQHQHQLEAERLAAEHADSESIYTQYKLSQYEKELKSTQEQIQQFVIEIRTLGEALDKETTRANRNEAYILQAEKKIFQMEAASMEFQRKATRDMEVLVSKFNGAVELLARFSNSIRSATTKLQERQDQMVQDAEDRVQFEDRMRDWGRQIEEKQQQMAIDTQRMEGFLRAVQTRATDIKNQQPTSSQRNTEWNQGSTLTPGGSLSAKAPSDQTLRWTEPVRTNAGGGETKAAQPLDRPRLNLLEQKYVGRSRADSDSYNPSIASTSSPAFSYSANDSPTGDKWFDFRSPNSGERPLALELGLDSRDDLQYIDRSGPSTLATPSIPSTPPTNQVRTLSFSDSGSILSIPREDDEQIYAGASSLLMQLVPRKRMRFTSPAPTPEARFIPLDDGKSASPALSTKRMKTNHTPPTVEKHFPQVVREFPNRAMLEDNHKKSPTANRASQVCEDELQPTPKIQLPKQKQSIIHQHLQDLPFRSTRAQTEWTRQISLPVNPLTAKKSPLAVTVTNERQEDISQRAKRELPKTLTIPGAWPGEIISEADLNETEIHPIGYWVDSVGKWLVQLADERPHELACGIFAIGSLFWVWLGHQSHHQWLTANEVPLRVLMKLRNSPVPVMSWTETIRFDVMRLLNVDRVMLG